MYNQLSPTAPFQPAPPAAIAVPTPLLCDLCFRQAWVARFWQMRTCRGGLQGKRPVALPQIHCRTQLNTSKAGGISRKMQGKGRKSQTEKGTKGVRSSRGNTKISRGGKALFWSRHSCCSPWRAMPDQMDMPDETAACGVPTLEQRKTMRRKQQQHRGTPMY